jgi:hypothetical protein
LLTGRIRAAPQAYCGAARRGLTAGMRRSEHWAAARRDELIGRTRAISLGIVSAAAAASLGLGMAFAHETPGHASTVPPASPTSPSGSSGGAASASPSPSATSSPATPSPSAAPSSATPSPSAAPRSASSSSSAALHHTRHHKRLTAPQQQPAPTSAAPQVSSGGS